MFAISNNIKNYIKPLVACIIMWGLLTVFGLLCFGKVVTLKEWVQLSVALKTGHFFFFVLVMPCFGGALALFGICRYFYLRKKKRK